MRPISFNNQNNHPNFKELYVSKESLWLLRTSRKDIKNMPLLKDFSKDINLFVKTKSLGWFRKVCEIYATPNVNLSKENFSNKEIDYYLNGPNCVRITPSQRLFHFYNLSDLKDPYFLPEFHSILKSANLSLNANPLIDDFYVKNKEKVTIKNLMNYLEQFPDKKSSYKVYNLLENITQNPNLYKSLIKDILKNESRTKKASYLEPCEDGTPAILQEKSYIDYFSDMLKNKMDKFLYNKWLNGEEKGYRQAYNAYYNSEIYGKAQNLMDLIKISPNVAPWTLRAKAREIGQEVTLGKLPDVFQNIKTYRNLIEKLQLLNTSIHSTSEKKFLQNEDGTYNIKLDNQLFKTTPKNGCSAKLVFKLSPDNSNENYYIKVIPDKIIGDDYASNKNRENYDLRPDSPYMNAIIDFYLKENKCKNANDIQFYDADSQSVLYKESIGKPASIFRGQDLFTLRKRPEISEIYNLGVQLNDISPDNFIITENGRMILIDSGHASFHDDFKPLVMGKQITLGNYCGRE